MSYVKGLLQQYQGVSVVLLYLGTEHMPNFIKKSAQIMHITQKILVLWEVQT
jgi:hypothetical protein